MKQGEGTTIWGNDKITYTLFPEVYAKFVFELMKHHPDLIQAMQLAQVKIEDGSAFQFLNTFLGTNVQSNTPMEIGFASLLDALKMRSVNKSSQIAMDRVAKQFENNSLFPARSDLSKPIFPEEPDQ